MADLPDPTSNGGASTLESDDISSLLNTLLQNSSQISTSAHLTPLQNQPHEIRRQFPVSVPFDSSSCVNLPFFSSGLNDRVENPFLTSIPFTMEGIGHADCESEEQEEGLVHRVPARSSSKRSRAAEVHNLSEKRRRQRINEKMKALQKLIPNSNKTDKASMLDEAIEYLKQLQLQVQEGSLFELQRTNISKSRVSQSCQASQLGLATHYRPLQLPVLDSTITGQWSPTAKLVHPTTLWEVKLIKLGKIRLFTAGSSRDLQQQQER